MNLTIAFFKIILYNSIVNRIGIDRFGELSELAEGARLEIVEWVNAYSRVRIPCSPPKPALLQGLSPVQCGCFLLTFIDFY